tara:strand:+ start:765 stop:1052 length:288 start_codon:yes stop_codon:yes gene_type:complete
VLIVAIDNNLVELLRFTWFFEGSTSWSIEMSNVILFPSIAERDAKSFEQEIGKYGDPSFALARVVDMALNCKTTEIRARAQRWALEIMNVEICAD